MSKGIKVLISIFVIIAVLGIGVIAGLKIKNEVNEELKEYNAEKNAVTNNKNQTPLEKDNIKSNEGQSSNNVDKEDFIGEEKAKEIALKEVGLSADDVSFAKVELDIDDGVWQYEVEFYVDRTEYSFDIKADDGTVRERDID